MSYQKVIESGMNVAETNICGQDKIWSRYSHDKVDIGEELAKVIRTLTRTLPLNLKLRALSLGSSDEPQFRILETAFRGGLYLLDINDSALRIVQERIKRQRTDHVMTIKGDYNKFFSNAKQWMILLYPNVHRYSPRQREEITEFVYEKFYKKKQPLIQEQDHLVVYKGVRFKGLI